MPLFHQASSGAGSEPVPTLEPVLRISVRELAEPGKLATNMVLNIQEICQEQWGGLLSQTQAALLLFN